MTDNQICNKCLVDKPLGDFHKNKKSKRGRLSVCKDCRNASMKKYRKTDRYHKNAAVWSRRYKNKHRAKNLAHKAVNRAINNGTLTRQPCEACGSTEDIHGHHDSYAIKDRLNVRWLCLVCHSQWHSQNIVSEQSDEQ